MYAVIEDRNQQFRVSPGERVMVPYLASHDAGASITFDKVCVVGGDSPRVGTPFVDGASVTAKVVGEVRGPKIVIQKFKRRKNHRKKTGFRAKYTELLIQDITA